MMLRLAWSFRWLSWTWNCSCRAGHHDRLSRSVQPNADRCRHSKWTSQFFYGMAGPSKCRGHVLRWDQMATSNHRPIPTTSVRNGPVATAGAPTSGTNCPASLITISASRNTNDSMAVRRLRQAAPWRWAFTSRTQSVTGRAQSPLHAAAAVEALALEYGAAPFECSPNPHGVRAPHS